MPTQSPTSDPLRVVKASRTAFEALVAGGLADGNTLYFVNETGDFDPASINADAPGNLDGDIFLGNKPLTQDIRRGTCSTAASTSKKVVTVLNSTLAKPFVLKTGAMVVVHFTKGNTASTVKLNVNGTGDKQIRIDGGTNAGNTNETSWRADSVLALVYSGTYWYIVNHQHVMKGATASANGAYGLVPKPLTTDVNKVLGGNGQWVEKQDPITANQGLSMSGNTIQLAQQGLLAAHPVIIALPAAADFVSYEQTLMPSTGVQGFLAGTTYDLDLHATLQNNDSNPVYVEFWLERGCYDHETWIPCYIVASGQVTVPAKGSASVSLTGWAHDPYAEGEVLLFRIEAEAKIDLLVSTGKYGIPCASQLRVRGYIPNF